MIIGQSGRSVWPLVGACLDVLDLVNDAVQRSGHQLMHLFRLIALYEIRSVAVAAEEVIQLFVTDPGQHAGIGDLVTVEVKDRQHAPSVAGFKNLFECQLVAIGPVSASPSPTTQATIRFGLSYAAP